MFQCFWERIDHAMWLIIRGQQHREISPIIHRIDKIMIHAVEMHGQCYKFPVPFKWLTVNCVCVAMWPSNLSFCINSNFNLLNFQC